MPVLALLLSYIAIAVLATLVYVNLKRATRNGHDALLHTHQVRLTVPHDHVLQFSLTIATVGASRTIQSINFPAQFIEFAIAKAARGQWVRWSPFHWNYWIWCAFAFPVFCMPFWWLAGVGIDGVFGHRRLRWWSLAPSLILWLFFLLGLSAYYFAFSPLERTEAVYPAWSVWLWFILLSAFPLAWLKQALARRRIKASLHARLSAELQ